MLADGDEEGSLVITVCSGGRPSLPGGVGPALSELERRLVAYAVGELGGAFTTVGCTRSSKGRSPSASWRRWRESGRGGGSLVGWRV